MELDAEIFNDPMVKLLIEECQKYNSIRKYGNPFNELPRRKFPKMISETLITILPNEVISIRKK